MTRRFPGSCLLLFAIVAGRAAADDLDEVMHLLAARRHGEANFVETQVLSLLKKPIESSGQLIYDAPDRLEKRTLKPRSEDLLVNGTELTVVRGGRARVAELKSYPQIMPFVESIRATLAGDRVALERVFRLKFSGGAARWSLVLAPLDPEIAKSVSEVRIEGAKDDLLQVEIRQADGDRSIMTLQSAAGQ